MKENNSMYEQEIKTLVGIVFKEYGSLTIDPKIVSKLINRSEESLARDRTESVGIPHTKLGKGNGSDRVLYNIYDVVKFIVFRKKKVRS